MRHALLGRRNFKIREFLTPENLRQSRKFRAIAARRSRSWAGLKPALTSFVSLAFFAVKYFFLRDLRVPLRGGYFLTGNRKKLFSHSKLPLRFTQQGGVGNFVQRNLACDVHGFSKIFDDDSQPVLRNRSVRAEDAHRGIVSGCGKFRFCLAQSTKTCTVPSLFLRIKPLALIEGAKNSLDLIRVFVNFSYAGS